MPYCTKCGKWVEPGQICSCSIGEANANMGTPYTGNTPSMNGPAPQGMGGQGPQGMNGPGMQGTLPQGGNRAFETGKAAAAGAGEFLEKTGGFIQKIPKFWTGLKNQIGIGEPETNDVDYYERNLSIVPQCVDADSGEIPIKQYNIAVLRTRLLLMRSEGRLQVTNKRVIFRATGRSLMGRTTLQHEFAIDEIAGTKIRKDHRVSFLNFLGSCILMGIGGYISMAMMTAVFQGGSFLAGILALVLTLLGIVPFFALHKMFPLKLLYLSVGFGAVITMWKASGEPKNPWMIPLVILGLLILFTIFIICFVPNLILVVETKGTQPSVDIRRKEWFLFNFGNKPDYTGFAEVLPWKDTEMAIIELWAMISDIQKYGDSAIEMWKV